MFSKCTLGRVCIVTDRGVISQKTIAELESPERGWYASTRSRPARMPHDRKAIVASLREQLKQGDKSLVGNRGFRRYLADSGKKFEVDEKKIEEDARI